MYSYLAFLEMGFSLILFLSAWHTARAASRLRCSGTAERLHRKTRKLLFRTGVLTVTALVIFGAIVAMMSALPSKYWQDRLMLNVPLTGAPLLAIWFTTLPMLWKLWKLSARTSGVLERSMKRHLSSRLFILPYQATALGAATSFYLTLVSPVPYDKLKLAAPIAVYALIMIGLWLHHDRRLTHVRDWLRGEQAEETAKGASLTVPEQAESRTRI